MRVTLSWAHLSDILVESRSKDHAMANDMGSGSAAAGEYDMRVCVALAEVGTARAMRLSTAIVCSTLPQTKAKRRTGLPR
jgi:hypothetical protein